MAEADGFAVLCQELWSQSNDTNTHAELLTALANLLVDVGIRFNHLPPLSRRLSTHLFKCISDGAKEPFIVRIRATRCLTAIATSRDAYEVKELFASDARQRRRQLLKVLHNRNIAIPDNVELVKEAAAFGRHVCATAATAAPEATLPSMTKSTDAIQVDSAIDDVLEEAEDGEHSETELEEQEQEQENDMEEQSGTESKQGRAYAQHKLRRYFVAP